MEAAQTAYRRLLAALYEHKIAKDVKTAPEKLQEYKEAFQNAIDDDINVPMALGVLWTMVKQPYSHDIYDLALDFDKVFGLSLDKARPEEKPEIEVTDDIRAIAEERWQARKNKNWAESDRLRDVLAEKGYAVLDSKDGYKLEKK